MLAFEAEVKVGLIEDVDANVTVLSAGCVAGTVRVEHDAVDGAEVTLHAGKLFVVKNLKQKQNFRVVWLDGME